MEHIIYQLEEDHNSPERPEVANGFHIPMCEEILVHSAEENPAVHYLNQCQWKGLQLGEIW